MAEGEVSLAAQLAGELGAAAWRWVAVLGPGRALDFQREAAAAAGRLALQLGDDNERADTVAGLMTLLWPDSDPPAEWWQETPLGRIGAMSLGTEHAHSWTRSVAAAWLGVTVGTVAQLVARGTLSRHPDGGLVPADVVRYGEQRRSRGSD